MTTVNCAQIIARQCLEREPAYVEVPTPCHRDTDAPNRDTFYRGPPDFPSSTNRPVAYYVGRFHGHHGTWGEGSERIGIRRSVGRIPGEQKVPHQ